MTTEERPAPVDQRVTASSGFAYGAVGADVHVFGDGTPVYLLLNWRPASDPDPDWLRELPSRMLSARNAVVAFTGRTAELAELHQWRQQRTRLAARWLHGPGGAGKSRLAAQFASESAAAGWKVVTPVHGPGTVHPPPGSQDLRLTGSAGLLLIVDYADRWPFDHLTWLFSNSLLHQVEVPVRVLLIGRDQYGWPRLRAALEPHRAATSAQSLSPLPDGDPRADMYRTARDSFAATYGLADPAAVADLPALAEPEWGLTLTVQMAALVAVDAHVHGRRPPGDLAGLTSYLLDREHLLWTNRYGYPGHETGPTDSGYRTPPELMNQVVFAAAVTGPVPRPTGVAALDSLALPADTERLLADHAVCYPATDPGGTSVLEPLYPDRLAEDFLALTFPGHRVDYPAQPWAEATTDALITNDSTATGPYAYLDRAVTFLAAATDRWPHLGQRYLYPLLRQQPQLAVSAGSAALIALATITDIDLDVLAAVDADLPAGSYPPLDVGAAVVADTLTTHRLAHTTDPAERARLHHRLADRLANAGRSEPARPAAQTAVDLFRQLAQTDPAPHQADLAAALATLAYVLADLGHRPEALAATQETVAIRRRLATIDPAQRPELAAALGGLSADLARAGQWEPALAAAQEAVQLRRQLAAPDPYDLAPELTNLGRCLAGLGRRREAQQPLQEALDLYRRLAETNPTAYLPSVALALTNLGEQLGESGQRLEALAPAQESVEVYRWLSEVNPEAYLPKLALALNNLGVTLSELWRDREALAAAKESTAIRRRLADADPAAHLPGLATALNTLSTMPAIVADGAEAVNLSRQALAIRQKLAATEPQTFLPDLAVSLQNLGSLLTASPGESTPGEHAEALHLTEQAVTIRRQLGQDSPQAHLPGLAHSLSNLSNRLAEAGRPDAALAAAEESANLYRQLVQAEPDRHSPAFATILNSLSNRLAAAGRPRPALATAEESLAILRRLAKQFPDAHLPELARTLTNVGQRLAERGKPRKAVDRTNEAIKIRRRLAEADPRHLPDLAMSLSNLGIHLSQQRSYRSALDPLKEAVSIRRWLAQTDPGHLAGLELALSNLGVVLARMGRQVEATAAAQESTAIRDWLAAARR